MKDKLHIITIFSIVIGILGIAFIFDLLLIPDSFGKHGHYRWNAIEEIQSQKLINQNIKICKECHNNIYQLHEKDAHFNVPCVDCHGAGDMHTAYHKDSVSSGITKIQAVMKKDFKFEGCLYCHRKLKARPNDFPQVDQKEHFKFMHVIDSNTKCIDCHSPHEPLFLLADLRQSRLHPIVYKCTDCHTKKPIKNYQDVADHPKIFECKDCHKEIVKDFNNKTHHNNIECRTCHLFHKENENVGRMYKNGNMKFCLICHLSKPFKDPDYPPKINWPSHIDKLESIEKTDTKICLDCHAKQIHIMNVSFKGNPHPGNWIADHKTYAKTEFDIKDKSSCQNCHTKDYCYACHKVDMPHTDDFLSNHGDIIKNKGIALCNNCHTKAFCKECHD